LWEELGNQIYVYLSSVSLHDVVERRIRAGLRPAADDGGPVIAA
jgi:Rrf2 family iron-sulfur cluster assembly transcriptional regulator